MTEDDKEQKGWFWDDINRRYYRWYELKLLMQEREIKAKREKSNENNE
jgi:hypothetical protein|tara:strand:+ start:4296 stop:4439 length:144 start_codon:yes stop_codon:yes gene_type:complete